MPLLIEHGAWHVLLTKRNEDMEHHKGQIAFPGGATDEGEDCVQTALREAQEEINLRSEAVDVVSCLSDIWTPSGYVITPVAGFISSLEGLALNPAEVSRIFTAPLSHFASSENVEIRTRVIDEKEYELYYYYYAGETIWGATALMLRQLLSCTDLMQ